IPKVKDLPDRKALTFEAVGLDPAVGQPERQLVCITDTILAGEAVVAPQRGITERAFAAVEDRDVVLVFIGRVQVEQARLKGLAEGLAEQLGIAIEIQAGIQAEDRDTSIRCIVECIASAQRGKSSSIEVQVVLGVGVFDRRLDEAPGPLERQADAGFQVYTAALGALQATQVFVVPTALVAINIGK